MERARYQFVRDGFAGRCYIWDRNEQRILKLFSHPIESLESVVIAGVEYVLYEDGETLVPVTPQGGIFRATVN